MKFSASQENCDLQVFGASIMDGSTNSLGKIYILVLFITRKKVIAEPFFQNTVYLSSGTSCKTGSN